MKSKLSNEPNPFVNSLFFCAPSRLILDAGAINRVAALCAKQRWKNALVVTDSFFSQKSKVVEILKTSLDACSIDVVVFDGGEPDPSTSLCDHATAVLQAITTKRGVSFDHVIALGGGSNIDLAKALSVTLAFKAPIAEFIGHSNWPGKPIPLVAIPTTSGTGSEITPEAILIDPLKSTKVAVMKSNDIAICSSVGGIVF